MLIAIPCSERIISSPEQRSGEGLSSNGWRDGGEWVHTVELIGTQAARTLPGSMQD